MQKQSDFDYSKPIALFDKTNLQKCSWPNTENGEFAKNYLTPFILNGVNHYISNIKTNFQVLVWDQLVLPISINETDYDNSYVCSPYSFFISYACQSLDVVDQKWLKKPIAFGIDNLGKLLTKCGFNQVVTVNNWFFSTNLYPPLNQKQIHKVTQFLKSQFPYHTIIFPTIDPKIHSECYEALKANQFQLIAHRPILFIDHKTQEKLLESRIFKSDQKLLKESGYTILENKDLKEEDIPRLVDLYQKLYIEKYSQLNPQLTENYIHHVLNHNLLEFRVLKKEGRLDGVAAYFQRNGKMFCAIFGYDQQLPKEASLYRILSTVLMLEAHKKGLLFHLSSGAFKYKTIRKAQTCIEYLAVSHDHLSYKRRFPWRLLQTVYNSLGLFYMKRI